MAFRPFITNLLGLDGTPESGGLLQSYVKDTTTPLPLYSDAGVTPRTNPIVAESLGQVTAYFNDALSYSWQAKTADNATTLWRADVVAGVLTLTFVNPDYDVFPIVDLAAVRSTSTYAALTGLMAATGLIDGAVYVTKARSSADDGGHGQWRYDAASVATADGGTVLAKDGGGAGRFFRLWNGSVDPRWFGASTSAVAATNQTAFGNIPRGSAIDLLDGLYAVSDADAIEERLRLYRGTLNESGTLYPQYPTRRAHPLEGGFSTIEEDTDAHIYPGPFGHDETNDVLIGAYVKGWRHEASAGAMLRGEISRDGGRTWQHQQTVYSADVDGGDDYEPRGLVGGMVDSDTFGVFYVLVDASSGNVVTNGCRFTYTSDLWGTFTTVSITGTAFYPHGELIRAANGDLVVQGYGGGNIYQAVSDDDGATWTISTAKAGAGSITQPVEPITVQCAEDEYLLFVRDGDGSPGNMWVTASADGKTWNNSWVDTAVGLASNPPTAVVWGGWLTVYLAARRSTGIDNWQDKLLYFEKNASDYYAEILAGTVQTAPPMHVAYAFDESMIGYLAISPLRGGYFAAFGIDRETPHGSSVPTLSRLFMLGGYPGGDNAPTAQEREPFTHNSSFERWSGAATVSSITTTVARTADRWLVNAGTGTLTATRTANSNAVRKLLNSNSRYCLNIEADTTCNNVSIRQRFYGQDIMTRLADRPFVAQAIIDGAAEGVEFRFYAEYYFGSGGSPSTTVINVVTSKQDALAAGLTALEERHYTPTVEGKTFGSDNNAYADFYLFITKGTDFALDFNIRELGWNFGAQAIGIPPYDADRDGPSLDRYTELLTIGPSALFDGTANFGSASTGVSHVFYAEKIKTPTVALGSGVAASDFLQNGSDACDSVTFDLIGRISCRIVYGDTGAGFSTGIQEVRTSSNGAEILVSVE